MDFFKKAKAQMKEAVSAVKEGEKNARSAAAVAQTTGAILTAPRTKSSVDLPLTVKLNVRQYYDPAKAEAERKISKSLRAPWHFDIDYGKLYEISQQPESVSAKGDFGQMLAEYVKAISAQFDKLIASYGAEGVEELNSQVSTHSILLEEGDGPISNKATCDVHNNCLRILFEKGALGYDIEQCAANLESIL